MRRAPDWRLAFVQALILWAAYMILTTEMLSLFSAVTRLGFLGMDVVEAGECSASSYNLSLSKLDGCRFGYLRHNHIDHHGSACVCLSAQFQ